MAARLDAPVLGVQETYNGPNRWQISASYRYQRSARHFVGPVDQIQRERDGSAVVNTINQEELGIRYNPSDVWSVSVGIPYLYADRSSPIRDSNRVVVARSVVSSRDIGDVTLTTRRLLWHPRDHPDGNVSFGLGVKFPTGRDNVVDTRTRLVNGQFVDDQATIDQSVQPGDGGYGAILDLQGFTRIAHSGFALFGGATYLVNPRNTNGVPTFRSNPAESVMSVADQYLGRIGFSYSNPSWKGFGASLGGRVEGVPVEDLIGKSDGFRRPGYAVSYVPGLSYAWGPHALSLEVPIAAYRNRTRSVADRLTGGHGDAAFADYVILLGYWRKY